MSEKIGYISIQRKITDHWIFEKNRPRTKFEAWLIILMEVNHSEQKALIQGEVMTCKRGESLKSLETWAKLFNWEKSKVRRFLKLLESDSMVVLKSTQKTTHLSVCNYDSYQSNRNTDATRTQHARNTHATRTQLNNNDSNVNNVNNELKKEYPPKQVPATVFSFDEFWEIYSKKKDRVKCEKKYKSVSEKDRLKIKDTLQKYIDSTPDIQFRKNPLTYLNSKTWEDEIQTTDPLWKHNSYRDKDGNIITPIEGNKNFVLRNGIETYVCR